MVLAGGWELGERTRTGGEDAWLRRAQAEALARKIPGADLRLIPGAGHFVMEDAPDEVGEILARFFAATPDGVS